MPWHGLASAWGAVAIGAELTRGAWQASQSRSFEAPAAAPAKDGLTIVTVVQRRHYRYVNFQAQLIRALNGPAMPNLVVVDNEASAGFDSFAPPGVGLKVLRGVAASDWPEEVRGSYQHSSALQIGLASLPYGTRWLLVIDPDFFVVRRNWIAECIEHMRTRGLGVFGAPWHPASIFKWRGFPCPHFILFDLEKIDLADIDFTPAVAEDRRILQSRLVAFLRKTFPLTAQRLMLQSRRDTGWKIRRRFRRQSGFSDTVTPVVDPPHELVKPRYLKSDLAARIEPLVPPRWSFFPAEGAYVVPEESGFDPLVLPSLTEKFVWRGAPFAVHLRLNRRGQSLGRGVAPVDQDDELMAHLLATAQQAKSQEDAPPRMWAVFARSESA